MLPHVISRSRKVWIAMVIVAGCGVAAMLARPGLSEVTGSIGGYSADRGVPAEGDVYQSGKVVGRAVGVRILARDTVEFAEIANANELRQIQQIEFAGYRLRIEQVRQVNYASSRASLVRVVAKIIFNEPRS